MKTTNIQTFIETVERFPHSPGIYIMKDDHDLPLYIGKAIDLKSRVRSYFSDTHEDRPHIQIMLSRLHSIEWIATTNESEALILEANLIRKHKPRFNIDLKDDTHYPYLKITLSERFPRLLVVRKVYSDGARYFGPYTDVRAMRSLMTFARRIFKIRDCKRSLPLKKPVRPCVNYSIGRCSGACAGLITEQQYRRNIDMLIQFLRGRRKECIREMQHRMREASNALRFEEAGLLRNQIRLMQDASRLQTVDLATPDFDGDVCGIYKGDRSLCLAMLHFREGLLISARQFIISNQAWEMASSGREIVLLQYYLDSQQEAPEQLCVADSEGFDGRLMEQWFLKQYGATVRVTVPQRGVKRQLVEMAIKNARLYLMQKLPINASEDIEDLQALLGLPKPPRIIEAFDISNIGSAFSVAGMVQFRDGAPDKSNYRRYKITTVSGQNDFAMLIEAVTRRLTRQSNEGKPFADCLLIDGGLGQLHAAMDALRRFSDPPPVIALAKKEELLYSSHKEQSVRLPATHPVRKLVERIRDEVHRWAIAYHRHLRGRQFKATLLRSLPGIGPKKALALLRTFGSVSGIRAATVESIARVEGFSTEAARKLLEQLREK